MDRPTAAERYFFETNGYLVLENLLPPERVAELLERLQVTIAKRRAGQGTPLQNEQTRAQGLDTRIFHILDDDPVFTDMIDPPELTPYIRALLNETFHFHASDAIWEEELKPEGGPGWHMDGRDAGYRGLRPYIPHLQLKVGYFLSDMSEPDQGNLMLVPGSHRTATEPTPEQLSGYDTFPGAIQVCATAGTAILFHNAMWHTRGPHSRSGGRRVFLYYAYEQPWMIGNAEHWKYSTEFYNGLSAERRQLFHGFVFDPPEIREY